MLTVVTWLWSSPGYRSSFSWEHVELLAGMVRRHYPTPHRFCCITNVRGAAAGVERIPDQARLADVPSPHGRANPSCYRRLALFDPVFASALGPRLVSLDLDVVITGDLRPLWDRPEDLVLLKDTGRRGGYNGSMLLMTAGCRPQVWRRFDAMCSPQQALLAGRFGSDQGWISYVLGDGEATWSAVDGVYSYRHEVLPRGSLPPDARMVVFHGANVDPWLPHMRRIEWIAHAYSSLALPPASY